MAKDKSSAASSENLGTAHPDKLLRVGDPAFQRLLDAAETAERGGGARPPTAKAQVPVSPPSPASPPVAEDAAVEVKPWRVVGDWFSACSGVLGCPCLWGDIPPEGYCQRTMCWNIREGHYGDVGLDALAVAAVGHLTGSPLAISRSVGFLIDERAGKNQREALHTIFSGRACGRFATAADLTAEWLGVAYVPLSVSIADDAWSAESPGLLKAAGAPFRELMVPADQTCEIINPPYPEAGPGPATLGRAEAHEVAAFGCKWNWSGKSSLRMGLDFSGPGNFRWTAHRAADYR
ncbi:MAG: DUF1326 domain-containing protein [Rhodospirillales bacterium]|jgi:hypothetical protein|nr:DUF1326 domain-containing protein [Rhodospirillales bacterium]